MQTPDGVDSSLSNSNQVITLKDDLIALADKTRRGFSASKDERSTMKRIINELSSNSPTEEPAAAYYTGEETPTFISTLSGKWTLIYTDAPDITSLEGGPLSELLRTFWPEETLIPSYIFLILPSHEFIGPAKLGRIGQECSPPNIKNVIEWKRPEWASSLPFSGSEGDRVFQKVCCKGTAEKSKPTTVDLKLVGLELSGAGKNAGDSIDNSNGGPAALFQNFPVELEGPLSLTFGKFDILYLDDEMRITRTYQGYTTVNIREEEWF